MHFETEHYCIANKLDEEARKALQASLDRLDAIFPGSRWHVPGSASSTLVGPSRLEGRWGQFRLNLIADPESRDYIGQLASNGGGWAHASWHCYGGFGVDLGLVGEHLRDRVVRCLAGLVAQLEEARERAEGE